MKYYVLFAITCAAVAMGVNFQLRDHDRGAAFGDLNVSSDAEYNAPFISGFGADITQVDMQLTDVTPLRGPLMELDSGAFDISLDAQH